jgi:hypothetical protein
MKTYNSMYLGMCINNNDPERRGRVQIFIPEIMPALYENWNADGEDIEITCVGDNMPQGLKTEVVDRLRKILPWAEAASPIVGTSAPGNVVSRVIEAVSSAVSSGVDAVAGAVSSASQQVGNFLDQSPSGEPPCIGDLNALLDEAAKYAGNDEFGRAAAASYKGNRGGKRCGRGTHGVLGAMTGGKIPGGALGGNADSFAANGSKDFTKSGLYNPKTVPPANYLNDPSQWKVGDVIANDGGSAGHGHIQVWTGKAWVSDFTQNRVLQNSNYHSFALHRPNAAGEAVINQNMAGMQGNSSSVCERPSISGDSPSAPAQANSTPPTMQSPPATEATAAAPAAPAAAASTPGTAAAAASAPAPSDPTTYGNAANQKIDPPPIVTASPPQASGDAGGYTNNEILFAMRIAATESGAGVSNRSYVIKEICEPNRAVGYSYGAERNAVAVGAQRIASGNVDWNKVDLGFCQSNAYNNKQVGREINSGSYTNQITGTAELIRKLCGKSKYGAEVQQSIASGDFRAADQILGAVGKGKPSIGTKYFGLTKGAAAAASMTKRVNAEFGGDAKAAMAAINEQLPATPTIADISAGKANVSLDGLPAESKGNYAADSANGSAQGQQQTSLSQNTDSHGPMATQNLNGVAKGMFSFPAAGAMLWCFFREGNPLFPVYFAASYSQAEWSSVYSTGSPGPGYNPSPAPGEAQSTGGMMNLNGVGGIRWEDTHNPEKREQDQKSIMFFGEDGSNIFMGKGYNQYYTRFDRRDQVEGDRWVTTLGTHEQWTQGDNNNVTMGDVYIKIGNVSSSAAEAVDKIHKIIQEIQKPLQESSGGGGGGGGGGSAGSSGSIKQDATLPPKLQEQIDKQSILNKLAPDPGKFKYNPNASPAPVAPVQTFSRASFITQQK